MNDIKIWLHSLGLDQFAEIFVREQIDLEAARTLSDSDLKELGLPLGPRSKLRAAIQVLQSGVHVPDAGAESESFISRNAERRQLTVLFCDLVGSTQLSQQLDPERLRELMQAYQQTCRGAIEKYEGHVAQYLGDGLMVYFGWPRAHEDDAERAVRSALEIVGAVSRIEGGGLHPSSTGGGTEGEGRTSSKLQVRIGIATGPVVVGETGAGDASVPKLAVGETPNLAARLQGVAGPDQIVVAPSTRRLLGAAFEYRDFGSHPLKGIVEPVRAWQVLGLSQIEDRFEAAHTGARLNPLVGREEEVALLLRRWELARGGEGQVVLVRGEAGIGKSRITQALRERVVREAHLRMSYQCLSLQTQNALYPILQQLERAAQLPLPVLPRG